jgi:site-specific DNA-methyltransferase (adenine-specific)
MVTHQLYYGDNLFILREHIQDESVDLIYLDPPFNSNRSYNVLFKEEGGKESEAQITAFEDTWHWNIATEHTYHELVTHTGGSVGDMVSALRSFIGTNQMMAYLVMMAARMVELYRVLKPTGTIYLHCDPTASHYLKILMDSIFGAVNFRNEVIWQRINAKGNVKRKFGAVHDVLLVYAKHAGQETWNQFYSPLDPAYVQKEYRHVEEGTNRRYSLGDLTAPMQRASAGQVYEWKGIQPGESRCWVYAKERMQELEDQGRIVYTSSGYPRYKRYLDESLGEKISDVWTDIPPALGKEIIGYPTQKPLALLERIIEASSNEGDIVLDPFCGCGTAVAAAHKLNRHWIGIDITHLAIALVKYRMEQMFPGIQFTITGEPKDEASARHLAQQNRHQFEWWALSLVRARPSRGQTGSKQGKKGSDKGIDGVINFIDDATSKAKRALVQVKSGKVKSGDIRDLLGTVEREQAQIGVFITLEPPTRDMISEAASAGFYHSPGWNQDYPRIQVYTITELLQGTMVKMPPPFGTFKHVQPARKNTTSQTHMDV